MTQGDNERALLDWRPPHPLPNRYDCLRFADISRNGVFQGLKNYPTRIEYAEAPPSAQSVPLSENRGDEC